MNATENAANPKINIEMEWTAKGSQWRSFRIWMHEGWSQSFLQKLTPQGWATQ
jgi:hypothetical protein